MTFDVVELDLAQVFDESVIEMATDLADGLDFLAGPRLARGKKRLTFINSHGNIEDRGIGEISTPLDREIALCDVIALQTRRCVIGDNAKEEAASLLDGFAEFSFPVLPRQDLLWREPHKETFVLKLFDDEFSDREIGGGVADKDAARRAVSEAMVFFHNSGVIGTLRVGIAPATSKLSNEFARAQWDGVALVRDAREKRDDLVAFSSLRYLGDVELAGFTVGGVFGLGGLDQKTQ